MSNSDESKTYITAFKHLYRQYFIKREAVLDKYSKILEEYIIEYLKQMDSVKNKSLTIHLKKKKKLLKIHTQQTGESYEIFLRRMNDLKERFSYEQKKHFNILFKKVKIKFRKKVVILNSQKRNELQLLLREQEKRIEDTRIDKFDLDGGNLKEIFQHKADLERELDNTKNELYSTRRDHMITHVQLEKMKQIIDEKSEQIDEKITYSKIMEKEKYIAIEEKQIAIEDLRIKFEEEIKQLKNNYENKIKEYKKIVTKNEDQLSNIKKDMKKSQEFLDTLQPIPIALKKPIIPKPPLQITQIEQEEQEKIDNILEKLTIGKINHSKQKNNVITKVERFHSQIKRKKPLEQTQLNILKKTIENHIEKKTDNPIKKKQHPKNNPTSNPTSNPTNIIETSLSDFNINLDDYEKRQKKYSSDIGIDLLKTRMKREPEKELDAFEIKRTYFFTLMVIAQYLEGRQNPIKEKLKKEFKDLPQICPLDKLFSKIYPKINWNHYISKQEWNETLKKVFN